MAQAAAAQVAEVKAAVALVAVAQAAAAQAAAALVAEVKAAVGRAAVGRAAARAAALVLQTALVNDQGTHSRVGSTTCSPPGWLAVAVLLGAAGGGCFRVSCPAA